MNRRDFLIQAGAASTIFSISASRKGLSAPAERPNILWLFLEDTSPWIGCYGSRVNRDATPNIDGLAKNGVRFSRAYVSAPVCSPCRSAMITGAFQGKFGVHEHRSSRAKDARIELPENVELLPEILKNMGYFTFNKGKTDYNFVWDQTAAYSASSRRGNAPPWRGRKAGQPFFGQVQMKGGKGNTKNFPEARTVRPQEVSVSPEYPDNEIYREVFAQHLTTIRKNDDEVGNIIRQLEEDGLLESTVIFYFSDHGANHLVRHKQMPTEAGLHVPLIVLGPGIDRGKARDDLVSTLDISATTLRLAGGSIPAYYDGQDLFPDSPAQPREFVFSGRDRCDHTIEFVRTARSDRYRYTRNFLTDRVFLQPQYRDGKDYLKNLRELYAAGELPPRLIDIYFGERPDEELYDMIADPHQLNDLAGNPAYAEELQRHREALGQWMDRIADKGRGRESDAALRHWGIETKFGRQAVNPEYERVRKDTDGDGLSDLWEKNTKRDPSDGVMHWEFECGGWQTEGWTAVENVTHLPGRQGFLDFDLTKAKAAVERTGLKLNTAKNQAALAVRLRASQPTRLRFAWREQKEKSYPNSTEWASLEPSTNFPETVWDLKRIPAWDGIVEAVRIDFEAPVGTTVEIDSIRVTGGDWDGDGVPDGKEAVGDTDADEIPNALDADSG